MTITKTGGVSHRAVLGDLDLNQAGSLRQRAVFNRLSRHSTSGNMTLDAHRGIACAPQQSNIGDYSGAPRYSKRDNGYQSVYPPGQNSGYMYFSGDSANAIINMRTYIRYYNWGDGSLAHLTNFRVNHSGTYRLTGELTFTPDQFYRSTTQEVAVIDGTINYVEGINPDANYWPLRIVNKTSSSYTINRTFNLTTSRPYVTIVLTAISKGSGDPTYQEYSDMSFKNLKIFKT